MTFWILNFYLEERILYCSIASFTHAKGSEYLHHWLNATESGTDAPLKQALQLHQQSVSAAVSHMCDGVIL